MRPTADRVRQAIFNILGQWMDGYDVLDLYAGTGAMALEALSRGAAFALMVDSNSEAVSLCRDNLVRLGLQTKGEVIQSPVDRAIADLSKRGRRFRVVFADPPYGHGAAAALARMVAEGDLVAFGGTLCIEHGKREFFDDQVGPLRRSETRRFGDTSVSFFMLA